MILELTLLIGYPNRMLKRFSYYMACLLLVLMPIQALAAANMLICNSIMQSNHADLNVSNMQQSIEQSVNQPFAVMSCHEHMAVKNTQSSKSKSACKSTCASLCASLCGLTAIHAKIQSIFAVNLAQTFHFSIQTYVSITQPNLQRPPILLS